MSNKRRTLRLYVRVGCLSLAILLLPPFPFWTGISRVFVHASSFGFPDILVKARSLAARRLRNPPVARRFAKRRGHARLVRLAINPVEEGALLFRIGFQQPLGHAALTEDNPLADEPAPLPFHQLGPFAPVLGDFGR